MVGLFLFFVDGREMPRDNSQIMRQLAVMCDCAVGPRRWDFVILRRYLRNSHRAPIGAMRHGKWNGLDGADWGAEEPCQMILAL